MHWQSVQNIWLAFVMIWCDTYSGCVYHLTTEKGSVCTSER